MSRIFNTLERWANLCGTWLIMFLMVLVCSDVIYRTISGKSIIGAIELSQMLMAGIAILTLSYTQKDRGHVRMELVIGKLKGRKRQIIEFSALLICLAFSILILIMTSILAKDSIAILEIVEGISGLPLWPWKTLVPIGFFLLSIRLAIQLVRHFQLIFHPEQKER